MEKAKTLEQLRAEKERAETVSYTHLDVYKRQGEHNQSAQHQAVSKSGAVQRAEYH